VVNRGIAKRPLFERREDMRFFLARLVRQIRLGRIEVHAYCLMTTHFHLLVRSPIGELSEAMRRVQNEHSRRFNRLHRRDGALARGRYFSRLVDSVRYRKVLVSYIDANPVRAGIVGSVGEYEFCSAAAYARSRRPRWLSSDWVESIVSSVTGQSLTASSYRSTFGVDRPSAVEGIQELVEVRLRSDARSDDLDDLIGSTPTHVREWMASKARLADGLEPGLPVLGPAALLAALEEQLSLQGPWFVEDGRRTWRGADLARAGLLKQLCGLTWHEIAERTGQPSSSVARLAQIHQRLAAADPRHADRSAGAAHEALARTFGP
jgi:REP element-mobilizing transposase RayT